MTHLHRFRSMTLCEVAARITALIYQAPLNSPAYARFSWQGYDVQLIVPEPHIATIEFCLGYIPFSAENRRLRADLLEMLEVTAIDLQVGLRVAPGGALWITAASRSEASISFERMIVLTALNILTLKPVMAYLSALLLPAPLDRTVSAA